MNVKNWLIKKAIQNRLPLYPLFGRFATFDMLALWQMMNREHEVFLSANCLYPQDAHGLIIFGSLGVNQGEVLEETYQQLRLPRWVIYIKEDAPQGFGQGRTIDPADKIPIDLEISGTPNEIFGQIMSWRENSFKDLEKVLG